MECNAYIHPCWHASWIYLWGPRDGSTSSIRFEGSLNSLYYPKLSLWEIRLTTESQNNSRMHLNTFKEIGRHFWPKIQNIHIKIHHKTLYCSCWNYWMITEAHFYKLQMLEEFHPTLFMSFVTKCLEFSQCTCYLTNKWFKTLSGNKVNL